MKKILLPFVMVFAGLLAGCSSGSSAPTLTSITVTTTTPSVAAGIPATFTATGNYSSGPSQNLTATATWTSSNTAVATIASGTATTLTQGSTTITASMSGVSSGPVTLTVTAPVLDSIAVTPANDTVPVGTLTQFTATGTYSDNSTQNLTSTATWTSSNTSEVAISAAGLATALATTPTAITIMATSGTINGSTGLTVGNATLMSIVLSGAPTVTIAAGTSYQFTAWGFYNDGSKHNITMQAAWTSSNTSVATIGATTGRAQGVAGGLPAATITATLDSVSGMAALDVTTATIQSITVGPSSTTIAPLTNQGYTAIGTFSDATTQNITQDSVWASSSTGVATISNTAGSVGVATGVAPGGATTISATFTFGGATATGSAPLTVSSATLTSITVTPGVAGLTVGSNLALQAVAKFSDGTTQHVETVAIWLSSAPTVAAVSAIGIVTGQSTGSAAVTCQLGTVTSTPANLTVQAFTAITISGSGTVAEGTSIPLKATGTLMDGTTQDLTNSVQWTSSDSTIATVSAALGSYGQATGVAPGIVTVTAVFAGQVGVASLTVTNATLSSIAIKPVNPTIALGSSKQFTATGTFSDGSTENLTGQVAWTSSDIGVAIINSSGAISTTGTGTTAIEAAFGAVSGVTVLAVN
ncbi:MAG: Ig-like domain-containing protein [Terriglobales bacterium]